MTDSKIKFFTDNLTILSVDFINKSYIYSLLNIFIVI